MSFIITLFSILYLLNIVKGSYGYIKVSIKKNWVNAEAYCLANYDAHLASIFNDAQNTEVASVCGSSHECIIGATDQSHEGTWEWIDGNSAPFTQWAPGQPDNSNSQHCAQINWSTHYGKWDDLDCIDNPRYFICNPQGSASNSKQYIFVNLNLNYIDAYAYCNKHYDSSLAIILNDQDNTGVKNACGSNRCWIAANDIDKENDWKWLDNTKAYYQNWAPGQPDNANSEHCVEMSWGGYTGKWNDAPCISRTNRFVCNPQGSYSGAKKMIMPQQISNDNKAPSQPWSNINWNMVNFSVMAVISLPVLLIIFMVIFAYKYQSKQKIVYGYDRVVNGQSSSVDTDV